jgi:hypothetical protein
MILYHRTSKAEAVLSGGFQDAFGSFIPDREWRGVWLSDNLLGPNEGAWGHGILAVDVTEIEIELPSYELVEQGKPFREWLVPAALLNDKCSASLVE